MPNIENLKKLVEVIKAVPEGRYLERVGFSMTAFVHECGTPSCMAGFAATVCAAESVNATLTHDELSRTGYNTGMTFEKAARWLELNQEEARTLFYVAIDEKTARFGDLDLVTKEHALEALSKVILGKPRSDWWSHLPEKIVKGLI
jgi:hypothetical protein